MTVKNADSDPRQEDTADAPDIEQSTDTAAGKVEPDAGQPSDDPVDVPGESAEDLAAALAEARERIQEMRDGHLRAQAEVENIRRRSQNEVVTARKFALEAFARELLTVFDSLDQAAQVDLGAVESDAVEQMQEGLALTLKQLTSVFGKFDVTEVEAGPGVKFNPEHHQAISMQPAGEIPADHIISVMQKGYLLKDRLLRPAMVVVAS